MNGTTAAVGILASVPGLGALFLLWRYAHRNRVLIRRVDRLVNDHERILAQLEGRQPHLLPVPDIEEDE